MIPPLSINVYPPNLLEGTIARRFVTRIETLGEYANRVDSALILETVRESRAAMYAAGWTPSYQHIFLRQLRNDLTELTECHPLTRQFIEILDLELECH